MSMSSEVSERTETSRVDATESAANDGPPGFTADAALWYLASAVEASLIGAYGAAASHIGSFAVVLLHTRALRAGRPAFRTDITPARLDISVSSTHEESVMAEQALRVLFLCTGNSARSQMAEALTRYLSGNRIDAFSAGSAPQAEVHPVARAVLDDRYGIDTKGLYPKSMTGFVDQQFDYVITVCDRAAESCPVFPGDPRRIHWSFEDPAAVPGDEAQRRAFEQVATGLAGRLRIWMSLPEVRRRLEREPSDVR
jgi:arsenate reductase